MKKNNHAPRVELTNDQIIDNIYQYLNQFDIYKNYVKNDDHEKELIRVLNPDGSINEKITYGTPEFQQYVIEHIRKNIPDHNKILGADNSIQDKTRYNIAENQLLKITRKKLKTVKEGDRDYQPLEPDCYTINTIGNFGFINPGAKSFNGLLGKIERKVITDDLKMAEAIDLNYNQKEPELFDMIKDWARVSIVVPNFRSAATIIGYLLEQFGGLPKVHDAKHDKPDRGYEAFHLNTKYKDINVEFQFHTKDNLELKKATDIFYHAWVNIPTPDRSTALQTKEAHKAQIIKYCHMIYNRESNDFKLTAPIIDDLKKTYTKKAANPTPAKLSHFCEAYTKADVIQTEIVDTLAGYLRDFNKLINIELNYEK